MDKLKFPLSTLPGRGLFVDVVVTEDDLRPEGARDLSIGPVTVKGQLTEVDGHYLFRGDIEGEYRHMCDRCLGEAEVPFDVDVLWAFEPGEPSEELSEEAEDLEEEVDRDRSRAFQGDELDLAPHVWEEIVLAAPSKFLCREDCAGLCPRCGSNLNRERCSCPTEETGQFGNKGLQGLADLFPNLESKQDSET